MGVGFLRRSRIVRRKPHTRTNMNRPLLALVLLSAFFFISCGVDTTTEVLPTPILPTPEPTVAVARATAVPAAQTVGICGPGTLPAYIKEVVLARDTQGVNFTPVDVTDEFEPTQRAFHAIVTLENAPADIQMGSRWYLVQATGYTPNTKIDDNVLNVPEGGSRNVAFNLSATQSTWPPGDYCVEIYAEGNLALSKNFKVVGSAARSNATPDVLKQIVLAEDSDPGTFAPINATSKFKSTAPFIHAAVEIFEAPANTVLRARWYPPSQDPLDFELTTDGSRWLDFRLTPAPEGFPTGEYTIEIYVNDQLADTKTFIVE